MYLRFKRQKTTVFLSCGANEDLEIVKQRLSDATNQAISNIQLRNKKNELLDEEKTLREQGLHQDDIIYFVFKIPNSMDDWEDISIPVQSNNNNKQSKLGNKK